MTVELSFLVVNTEQRPLLRYCLDAIARERATVDFETEVLVLDNASQDGSADAARQHPVTTEVIALDLRRGKAENDTTLLKRARGRFCLLLNEDSELEPGATVALHRALADDDSAGAAAAMLVGPEGERLPSAWRFPSPATAFLSAIWLHRRCVVQSRGEEIRQVDWAQSAAMLLRRSAAEAIGWFDPELLRLLGRGRLLPPPARRRLGDAVRARGARRAPRAVRHRQRAAAADRRGVAQPRPLHAQAPLGVLGLPRALADGLDLRLADPGALVWPGRDHRRNARHAVAALLPGPRRGARGGGG